MSHGEGDGVMVLLSALVPDCSYGGARRDVKRTAGQLTGLFRAGQSALSQVIVYYYLSTYSPKLTPSKLPTSRQFRGWSYKKYE